MSESSNINVPTSATPQPPAPGSEDASAADLDAVAKELRRQLTPGVMKRARSTADREVQLVRNMGVSGAEDGADLVQTILLDTLTGRVRWRHAPLPDPIPLGAHLAFHIRQAARRLRASKRRHVTLSEDDDGVLHVGEGAAARLLSEPDHLLSQPDQVHDYELKRLGAEAAARLRALAVDEDLPDVGRALEALATGQAGTPKEIVAVTGLSVSQARHALRRLRALARQRLPPRLRSEVIDVLGGRALRSRSARG